MNSHKIFIMQVIYSSTTQNHLKHEKEEITSLCSKQAIMISDSMTTPVRPTPALQCTSTGGFGFLGSAVLFVWRRTDCISSKYAIKFNKVRIISSGDEAPEAMLLCYKKVVI